MHVEKSPTVQPLERRILLTTLDPAWAGAPGYNQPYPDNTTVEHAVAAVALVAGGKVLALADHTAQAGQEITATASLVRYNADGSLDTTFGGGDGILDLPDFASRMIVLKTSGEIVL